MSETYCSTCTKLLRARGKFFSTSSVDTFKISIYFSVPKMGRMNMIHGNGSDYVQVRGASNVTLVHHYDPNLFTEKAFWDKIRELVLAKSAAVQLLSSVALLVSSLLFVRVIIL